MKQHDAPSTSFSTGTPPLAGLVKRRIARSVLRSEGEAPKRFA